MVSFIRKIFNVKEMPMELVERERPLFSTGGFGNFGSFSSTRGGDWSRGGYGRSSYSQGAKKPQSPSATGAEKYGVKALPVGSAVIHQMFGEGVILSAKDLSGDVLYEVDFGSAGKKKLLATYAKLTLKK